MLAWRINLEVCQIYLSSQMYVAKLEICNTLTTSLDPKSVVEIAATNLDKNREFWLETCSQHHSAYASLRRPSVG